MDETGGSVGVDCKEPEEVVDDDDDPVGGASDAVSASNDADATGGGGVGISSPYSSSEFSTRSRRPWLSASAVVSDSEYGVPVE
jgi:hypothetical protein